LRLQRVWRGWVVRWRYLPEQRAWDELRRRRRERKLWGMFRDGDVSLLV
jgi:hypothetical protein